MHLTHFKMRFMKCIVFLVDPGRGKNSKCRPKRLTQKKCRPNNGRPKKVDPKIRSTQMVDPKIRSTQMVDQQKLKPFRSTFIWGRPFLGRHFWVDLSELSQSVDFQVDPPGRLRTLEMHLISAFKNAF